MVKSNGGILYTMSTTLESLEKRLAMVERRLETLEQMIERLLPEDDERLPEIKDIGDVKDYKPGKFQRLAKERGLI